MNRIGSSGRLSRARSASWRPFSAISGGGGSHGKDANPANDVHTTASFGPASDGRIKPDICSYYDNVLTSDRPSNAGYNTAAGVAGN